MEKNLNTIKFNNIKWIFFDVGFTLVSEEKPTIVRAEKQVQLDSAKRIGLTKDKIIKEMYIVSNEYKNQYKAVMAKYNIDDVVAYEPEYEEIYPEVYQVLEELSKRYKLGIIANQTEGLKKRLKERKLDKYFSIVCASFEEKLHKPDLEFFLLALNRANAKSEECVMIGDRLDNDIYPAKKLGMKTIRILQGYAKEQEPLNEEYEPDYTISSLSNLLSIL